MEDDKAAAYYDELARKGGGAARFKQGLGFSSSPASTSDEPPTRGSALPTSASSFLSNFVRASSPSKTKELEKQTQLQNIQNKLKKKEPTTSIDDPHYEKSRVRDRDRRSPRRRSRSRERDRDRYRHSRRSRSRERKRRRRRSSRSSGSDEERGRSRRRRHRSSSRERKRVGDRDRDRDRERRRRRSRSRSSSDGERRHRRERGRSRSLSPRDWRSEKGSEDGRKEWKMVKKDGNGPVDYAKLIGGYDKMTPAERVKAKMKIQLSQTAEKDEKIGTGSGWERFDFDKDAPVDDEEVEAADDDAAVVKHINQTFRFTSLEAKKEDELRAAHDEAMFGAPAAPAEPHTSDSEELSEDENKETHDDNADPANSLINEKVLAMQQVSWRDRACRKVG